MTIVVDFTEVADTAITIAGATIAAVIPVVVPAILQRLKIGANTDLQSRLDTVLEDAAGAAYKYAQSREGGLSSVAIHDDAIGRGVQFVLEMAPTELKALGITPSTVTSMLTAKIGKLLATDPTVTASAPVPVPAAPAPAAPAAPASTTPASVPTPAPASA
jgi:hypothetical protein